MPSVPDTWLVNGGYLTASDKAVLLVDQAPTPKDVLKRLERAYGEDCLIFGR